MQPPDRLTVPTCIGCGAMSQFGTCDTGCREHKLELVRAEVYDGVVAARLSARARAEVFGSLAEQLVTVRPAPGEWEAAYRSLQQAARTALRLHPDIDSGGIDPELPAETAVTWWCPSCGGIDAPQPCLGICIWRPIEWVNRTRYERERDRAITERGRERRLAQLVHRVASVTPRAGQWGAQLACSSG